MSGFFWTVTSVCVWGSLQCWTLSCLFVWGCTHPVLDQFRDGSLSWMTLSRWCCHGVVQRRWMKRDDSVWTEITRSTARLISAVTADPLHVQTVTRRALRIQHVNINPSHLPSAADPSRRRRQTGASRLPPWLLNVTGDELWTRRWQRLRWPWLLCALTAILILFYMKTSHVGGMQTRCQERNVWWRRVDVRRKQIRSRYSNSSLYSG